MKYSLHFTFHKLAQGVMTCETASKFTLVEKTSLSKLSFIADSKPRLKFVQKKFCF